MNNKKIVSKILTVAMVGSLCSGGSLYAQEPTVKDWANHTESIVYSVANQKRESLNLTPKEQVSDEVTKVSLDQAILNAEKWYVSSGSKTANGNQLTFKGGYSIYQGSTYANEILEFKMNATTQGWPAITFRNQSNSTDPLGGEGACYIVVVRPDVIELQRFNNGRRTVLYGQVPGFESQYGGLTNEHFIHGEDNLVQVGAINTANGVRLIMNINGKNVFDCLDDGLEAIQNSGYFGTYQVDPTITLSTVSNSIVNESFEGEMIDTNLWEVQSLGNPSYIENGTFAMMGGTHLRLKEKIETDMSIEYEVKVGNDTSWSGFIFGKSNIEDTWDNGCPMLYIQPNGGWVLHGTSASGMIPGVTGDSIVKVKLEIRNKEIKVYFNDQYAVTANKPGYTPGYISFYTNGPANKASYLDNINIQVAEYIPSQSTQEILDEVQIRQPYVDEIKLMLPQVTKGFKLSVDSTSNPKVITPEGRIVPPTSDQIVNVVLKVVREYDGEEAKKEFTIKVPANSNQNNQGLERLKALKYGIFVHYVPVLTVDQYGNKTVDGNGSIDVNAFAERFDVEQFAQDVEDMNVDYVIFTAWHANMTALYPSEAMKKWGLDNHQTNRDLIGEMIDAVTAKGIKVYLYTHPRDGHDFPSEEAAKVGWIQQPGSGDPNFDEFEFDKWNDFIDDVYKELTMKYGDKVEGYFVDEGSSAADSYRVVDYARLRSTIKEINPELVLMHNFYGTNYSTDVGMKEFFYWGEFNQVDGSKWPAFDIPVGAGITPGGWWASQAADKDIPVHQNFSAENLFRYNVLQAGVNTLGGGVAWAAGPYPDGAGWEKGVKEKMIQVGQYIKPIEEAIKNTYPSTSYRTASGATTASVGWGVATKSIDDQYEYLHVLNAPQGNQLILPAPVDGKVFSTEGILVNTGDKVLVEQTDDQVSITLGENSTWDILDTVIKLKVVDAKVVSEDYYYINSTDKKIIYEGAWDYSRWERYQNYAPNWQQRGGDYDSDMHSTKANNASFEFTFTGTGIDYISNTDNRQGTREIYLDGELVDTITPNSSSYLSQQVLFSIKGLTNKEHTFKVVKTAGSEMTLDALKVYTEAKEISIPKPEPDPDPEGATGYLAGDTKIKEGQELELTYSLYTPEDISAQVIEFTYDEEVLRLDNVIPVIGEDEVCNDESCEDKYCQVKTQIIREGNKVIVMHLGEENAVNGKKDILKLTFTALKAMKETSINLKGEIAQGELANAYTAEINASQTVTVISGEPQVDKAELNKAITEAEALVKGAVPGDEPGQYSQDAIDNLQAAIVDAKDVAAKADVTQEEIKAATDTLQNAIKVFKAAIIPEGNRDEDVNGDNKYDVVDLAIVARYYMKNATDTDISWDEIKHADINRDNVINIQDLTLVANKILAK